MFVSPKGKGRRRRRVCDCCKGLDIESRYFDCLAGLRSWTDDDRTAVASERICEAHRLSVAANCEAERPFLRSLPSLLPKDFVG